MREGGGTGSYFDKLWSVRSKSVRYHVRFAKPEGAAPGEEEAEE